MATLRSEKKLAEVKKERQEEHPSDNSSRQTTVPRINEDYLTQFSGVLKGERDQKVVSAAGV